MSRASDRGGDHPAGRRGIQVFVPAAGRTSRSPRVPVDHAGLAAFERRATGAGGQRQSADCHRPATGRTSRLPRVPVGPADLAAFARRATGAGGQRQSAVCHRPATGRARGDGDPCHPRFVRRWVLVDWRPLARRSAGARRPQSRHPAGGRLARLQVHRLAACVPGDAGTARRRRRGAADRYFARPSRRRRAWAGTVPCQAACPGRLGADPWPGAPPDRLGSTCPDRVPPQRAGRDRRGTRRRPRRHEVRTHDAACGRRPEVCERTSVAPSWADAWPAPCAPPDPLNGRRGADRQLLRPTGDAVHPLAWQSP